MAGLHPDGFLSIEALVILLSNSAQLQSDEWFACGLGLSRSALGHFYPITSQNGVKMSRSTLLWFALLAFSGCALYDAPRNYKDLESLKRSNDFSVLASLGGTPGDATEIDVYSDIDSGLAMISYKTAQSISVSEVFDRRLPAGQYKLVQDNVGFAGATIVDIRYGCESREVKASGESLKYQQVVFLGAASGRQYRWDSVNPDVYRRLCSNPAVGA
ncbi:hypothetical protein VC218_18110 [Xanthomonas nasturtii]|uniref:hypothetical protein n=1 Tax=Xanthomonas nasturtii TaxID=1843581 RepID=UPI002B22C987|nr:hypothetical protein [Xanthomonas nasturtii]MEA9580738.1 hypothetical protein [Xanthomonas nasturtii]